MSTISRELNCNRGAHVTDRPFEFTVRPCCVGGVHD